MDNHYIIPCIYDGRLLFHIVQYDVPHTVQKVMGVLNDSPLPRCNGGHLSTHVAGVPNCLPI